MNKGSLQAFSVGIIFATSIMAGFYYGTNSNEKAAFTTADAKKMLEADGYSISKIDPLTKSEQKANNTELTHHTEHSSDTKNTQKVEKKEVTISYILKVRSKMTTNEIAKLLEKAKIIDNSVKFKNYMNKEKLSKQVQIGEYVVTSDMSYEELGKMITK